MKKNMIYIATGIVFLIFAVCIAYIFTEPTQTPQKQEAVLSEQDASQLTALNAEQPTPPSADALTFTAQENSQTITTPPAENTEQNQTNPDIEPLNDQDKMTFTHPTRKIENKQQEPAFIKDKPDTPETSQSADLNKKAVSSASQTNAQTAAQTTKNTPAVQEKKPAPAANAAAAPDKTNSNQKAVLQDKLPVPFVKDSLRTRTILDPKKNADTIIYSELMMDGNQVGFVFEGDKPIKPKTFRLTNPDRVVLDIEGYWVLKTPQLISNRMVKDIRSNSQKEKTRIVFDLKQPSNSSLLYRIHSRKYQLVFK